MHRGRDYELLRLNAAQKELLSQWKGCQRTIYNAKVEEDNYFYKFHKKFTAEKPPVFDQKYSHFKTELSPWLYEVPSEVLRNGAVRYYTAKKRFLSGLSHLPRIKKKNSRGDTLYLTKEIFRFIEKDKALFLELGTKTNPVFLAKLNGKRYEYFREPASITLRYVAGKWLVKFSIEDNKEVPSLEGLKNKLNSMDKEELSKVVLGFDRNIKDNKLSDSNGRFYDFSIEQKKNLLKLEKSRKKYQRKMARQKVGSNRREITKKRISKGYYHESCIRQDFAHKTSRKLVELNDILVYVFDALQIQNMVRKRKAKKDSATGKWLKNGASAKAGLNKAILGSSWGSLKQFTEYKALEKGKLFLLIETAYSSQECPKCGHVEKENRKDSSFVCKKCNHSEHADVNAAVNHQCRAIDKILNGKAFAVRDKKRVGFRKSAGGTTVKGRGENVRLESSQNFLAVSVKRQENPTTACA